jgi:hypothetical protein
VQSSEIVLLIKSDGAWFGSRACALDAEDASAARALDLAGDHASLAETVIVGQVN